MSLSHSFFYFSRNEFYIRFWLFKFMRTFLPKQLYLKIGLIHSMPKLSFSSIKRIHFFFFIVSLIISSFLFLSLNLISSLSIVNINQFLLADFDLFFHMSGLFFQNIPVGQVHEIIIFLLFSILHLCKAFFITVLRSLHNIEAPLLIEFGCFLLFLLIPQPPSVSCFYISSVHPEGRATINLV